MSEEVDELERLEQGLDRLSACLDTVSTNVKEMDGRGELRRVAKLVREESESMVLDKLFDELDTLFTHPDLESENTCIYASFMELVAALSMSDDEEVSSQMDLIENKLLDYKGDSE
jgi:hypothetical protein